MSDVKYLLNKSSHIAVNMKFHCLRKKLAFLLLAYTKRLSKILQKSARLCVHFKRTQLRIFSESAWINWWNSSLSFYPNALQQKFKVIGSTAPHVVTERRLGGDRQLGDPFASRCIIIIAH